MLGDKQTTVTIPGKQESAAAGSEGKAHGAAPDPRRIAMARRVRAARAYNATRPAQVAEFDRLTGGAAAKGVRAIVDWQRAHHLRPSGKVDDETIAAARQSGADVTFSDQEAGEIVASPGGAGSARGGGGSLAEQVVAGGVTGGEEQRLRDETGSQAKWASENLPEGIEHAAEGFDSIEEAGAAGKIGVKGVAFLANISHLANLLRERKYGEVAKLLAKQAASEDTVDLLKLAIEKAGVGLGPRALSLLEKVAVVGVVTDVLLAGWEWTKGG
jgi:hypothetical protein